MRPICRLQFVLPRLDLGQQLVDDPLRFLEDLSALASRDPGLADGGKAHHGCGEKSDDRRDELHHAESSCALRFCSTDHGLDRSA
jgi:hypothetical protein